MAEIVHPTQTPSEVQEKKKSFSIMQNLTITINPLAKESIMNEC